MNMVLSRCWVTWGSLVKGPYQHDLLCECLILNITCMTYKKNESIRFYGNECQICYLHGVRSVNTMYVIYAWFQILCTCCDLLEKCGVHYDNNVIVVLLKGKLCTHIYTICISMNMVYLGVNWKANSSMHLYILLYMIFWWL